MQPLIALTGSLRRRVVENIICMKRAQLNERLPEQYFETQDMQLAASISALGSSLLSIDRQDQNRCTFIFEQSPDLRRSVDAYWRRELSIEPQALLGALKAIKARLYGEMV